MPAQKDYVEGHAGRIYPQDWRTAYRHLERNDAVEVVTGHFENLFYGPDGRELLPDLYRNDQRMLDLLLGLLFLS